MKTRKQNTELALAIALTKLGDFLKAEIFAKRAVQMIERELKINKTISIEENICPSKDPKDIARFKLKMQSLCLAYHHLASIKKSLGYHVKAAEFLELSRLIGKKYVKDKNLLRIINDNAEKKLPKPSPIFSSKKHSLSDLRKFTPKMQTLSEKQLLSEIFGKNKEIKHKLLIHAASVSNISKNFPDSLPSISLNLHENSFNLSEKKSPAINENNSKISDEGKTISKVRIVNDISFLRKIEIKAAIIIQRFIRKMLMRKKRKSVLQDFIHTMILPDIEKQYNQDDAKEKEKEKEKEKYKEGHIITLNSDSIKDSFKDSL